MSRRLVLTRAARSDQARIEAWYRQPGAGAAAGMLLTRLDRAIARLPTLPLAHPDGPRPDTRLLVVQRHRIPYRVLADHHGEPDRGDIVVLRIYGPGQSDD